MKVLGTLRTYVRDMFFGKTSIRVVQQTDLSKEVDRPIFLLGCFRSGTSLMRLILDSHPNLNCPTETKFLVPIAGILDNPRYLAGANSLGFETDYIRQQFRSLFNSFHVGNMMAHNKKRWVDKTPDYLAIIPFIEWLYGEDCQFILLYRHGLDVAKSMSEMPGGWIHESDKGEIFKALDFWIDGSNAMKELEARRPRQCFAMRYEDLCEKQELLLREMFSFLNEPWDDRVMEWYRQGHDTQGGLVDKIAVRTEGFSPSRENFRKLPAELQAKLFAQAGPTLARLGYPTT